MKNALEKIRAEIERQREEYDPNDITVEEVVGYGMALDDIICIIDALEEQENSAVTAGDEDIECDGEITKRMDGTLGLSVYIDERAGFKFGEIVRVIIKKQDDQR